MQIDDVAAQFPYPDRDVYFNTAGVALTPVCVREEATGFIDGFCRDKMSCYKTFGPRRERLRENLAALMGAPSADQVAIMHHTAEGAGIIANGLSWGPDDTIVTLDREYPSTIYPWMNLEKRRGVRLVMLRERDGRVEEDAIVEAIERERPRMLALSAVEWCSGYRFDLEKIGAACRDNGVLFFVDGAQALGFTEVDVRACHIAALAGSGWKWLFGPDGIGYLYLRDDLLEEIEPVFVGSESVVNHLDYLDYDFTFQPGARRFEYSTSNLPGIAWFDASVRFLMDYGFERARGHVFDLQDYALERLGAMGCALRGDMPRERRSGIMAFRHPAIESCALSKRLWDEAGIVAMERDGFIRLAFHIYSTREGVDKLLAALETLQASA